MAASTSQEDLTDYSTDLFKAPRFAESRNTGPHFGDRAIPPEADAPKANPRATSH